MHYNYFLSSVKTQGGWQTSIMGSEPYIKILKVLYLSSDWTGWGSNQQGNFLLASGRPFIGQIQGMVRKNHYSKKATNLPVLTNFFCEDSMLNWGEGGLNGKTECIIEKVVGLYILNIDHWFWRSGSSGGQNWRSIMCLYFQNIWNWVSIWM